ncbi:bifunctional hydroxymethylpyrimidine kinase/phosphomethylpyrimidine kinase [Pseudomonadota bacterium]
MKGRVLIIAGSDSSGGAGIQADIKTVTALGGYAASAITALTAQDSRHIHQVIPIDPKFVAKQIQVVIEDIGIDCIKTGMLWSPQTLKMVCKQIDSQATKKPVVVDPILFATEGTALLDKQAIELLRDQLLPLATVATPNIAEAEILTGLKINSIDDMINSAKLLCKFGAQATLVTGGHLDSSKLYDVLVHQNGQQVFQSSRIDTPHTHGTGCTLSSAIATGLAQGMDLFKSITRARQYVHEAIKNAPGYGSGHGPLNHCVAPSEKLQG